jgi:quercetin dioxygenase-like cupin family protein
MTSTFILPFLSTIGLVAFGNQASIRGRLSNAREQINTIHRQILALINQRPAKVQESGKSKAVASQPHSGIRSEVLLQTTSSWNGAAYKYYPLGTPEQSVLKITIPPHQQLRWHMHPMPNVGFVLSGEIVVEELNGIQRVFSSGDAIAETVDTVHRGRTGAGTVVLLVFYAGVKGMALAQPKP